MTRIYRDAYERAAAEQGLDDAQSEDEVAAEFTRGDRPAPPQ
jgi:hypothetical protein